LIILSLLAAAGMAHAATPIYSWEWTAEGAQITAPNWNGSFNYTSGNDYATFGSGSGTPYNANITGITGSFTVSFDLKNLSSTSNGWVERHFQPVHQWDGLRRIQQHGAGIR